MGCCFSVSMADEKKNNPDKVVVAEFKIFMHCYGCERTVAKAISKIKGVEKFTTDMTKHKVVITGKIDPAKVVKKLRKKTGKRVESLLTKQDSKDVPKKEDSALEEMQKQTLNFPIIGCLDDNAVYTVFSDENPNACLIM